MRAASRRLCVKDSIEIRAQALALVVPSTAVVTDDTAAWLWGADTQPPGSQLSLPPVSMFQLAGNNRLRNGLCVSGERTLTADDIAVVNGVQVTTAIRTAWDLGRLRHRDRAFASLDALLALGTFDQQRLVSGVRRFRGHRGVVQLRELAPLADPRSQSPAESILRLRWLDFPSLPAPTPQVPVFDESGNEVFHLDLGIPELRFGADYDGEQWHGEQDREYDEQRREWCRGRNWTIRVFRKANVFGANQNVSAILHEGIGEARRKMHSFGPPL